MTNTLVQKIETAPGQEIRFEIEFSARVPRVSIRVWSALSGMPEKVPTGKGFSIEVSRFSAFKEAVLLTERALSVHE